MGSDIVGIVILYNGFEIGLLAIELYTDTETWNNVCCDVGQKCWTNQIYSLVGSLHDTVNVRSHRYDWFDVF